MNLGTIRLKARLAKKMPLLYRNWPLALVSMATRRKTPVVLRLRDGTQLFVRVRGLDTYIINEIWADKIYTPEPDYSIRDGWTIVDIGGHKGIFSLFAATRSKNVKVFTFEPSPDNFTVLCQNLRMNRISNVTAFNVAVGGQDGESLLYLYPDEGQNSMLRRSAVTLQAMTTIKVETWSLHRVIKTVDSAINLLKMDIEGMEYDTLLSCSAADLTMIERIAVEYHDRVVHVPHRVSELVRFLNSNGFSTRFQSECEVLLGRRLVGESRKQ